MRLAKVPRPIQAIGKVSPWITVKQAADYLGIGVEAVYTACTKGELKHARLGRSTIRLRTEWVDAWAESRAV